MKHLRTILGLLALLSLAVGLNVLVLREVFFIPSVQIPLAGFALFGLVWLILTFTRLVNAYGKGRTLYGVNVVVSSLLFLGICFVAYAFTKHWGASWDLTKEGRRTLAPQTVKVLKNLDQDVSILCLFNKSMSEMGDVTKEKTLRFLERCEKYTRRLHVEVMDPQEERARLIALGIEQRLSPQGTVVLRCGARKRIIPLSGVTARLQERDFTNALINVVRSSEPKVYFLTGHGEREITNTGAKEGASTLNAYLRNESYQTDELAIALGDPKIPADCDVLVIDRPRSDLRPQEIQALQDYMDRGGRMLILLDPWIVAPSPVKAVQQLLPWLARRYGIIVGNDLVWTPKDRAELHLVKDITLLGYPMPRSEEDRGSFNVNNPVTRGFDEEMVFAGARSVTLATNMPEHVQGSVLLRALPDSWAETDLSFLKTHTQPKRDPGELTGRFGVAVAVTAQTSAPSGDSAHTRKARMIVVGNSTFASNDQIAIAGHRDFILNAMAWLTMRDDLIAIRPTGPEPQPLLLTGRAEKFIAWLAVLGPVQVIAVIGLVMFVMRRRYQ